MTSGVFRMVSPFRLMHLAVDAVRNAPGVRHARKRAFDRQFERATRAHLFRGVFGSFEEAVAAAPRTRPNSYDSQEAAAMYDSRTTVQGTDYPAMFWLARTLQDGARSIFDLGGHIGIKYYAFRECMRFPPDLRWIVCDMPAVVDRGAMLAREGGADGTLQFSVDPKTADGVDVLYASGSLQYLPYTLADLLSGLRNKPATIVVNTTPIHPSRSFFTLNAIGTAFCPYRVTSEREFLDGVLAQGYTLRDQWRNEGKGMTLTFEEGYDVRPYSGYCFTRT